MNIHARILELVDEAVSAGDPNRGRSGRAKPKLPPGVDPYEFRGSFSGSGKLQARLNSLSSQARSRYYREIGMRSRAASRAGRTGRLYGAGVVGESTSAAKGRYHAALRRLGAAARAVKPTEKPKPIVNPFTKPWKQFPPVKPPVTRQTVKEGSRSPARTARLSLSRKPGASRSVQDRQFVELRRERMKAGLDPRRLPPESVQAGLHGGRTWAVKSLPHDVDVAGREVKAGEVPYRKGARVPKAVLKYREASAAKAAAAKAAKGIGSGGAPRGTQKKLKRYADAASAKWKVTGPTQKWAVQHMAKP